jgi:hypothetical protein
MSQFTKPFIGELIGENLWKVYEPFEYHVGEYPSDEIVSVPVGFVTNFASVPRIFWTLISPVDKHGKAAVVHDYLYKIGYVTQKRCDKIFREALIVLNTPSWKVFCMYWSVRLFGWYRWNELRRSQNEAKK